MVCAEMVGTEGEKVEVPEVLSPQNATLGAAVEESPTPFGTNRSYERKLPAAGEVVLFIVRLPAMFCPKFALATESEMIGEEPRVQVSVKLVLPARPVVALATTGSYAPKFRSPTLLITHFAATDAVALKFLLIAVACAGASARSRTAATAAASIWTEWRGMSNPPFRA